MANLNSEIEEFIKNKVSWESLPANIHQQLGNSPREYEKSILQFSIKNQLRYRGNLVKTVRKDERRYYEELIEYSKAHLMLFPYHLSDVVIKGLRITPFQYYIMVLESIMGQEKSYDSLPNFTAVDSLRLLGIGRNQYIDLMNKTRSKTKFGGFSTSLFRKSVRSLLPSKPVSDLNILPWWVIQVGFVTDDDVKVLPKPEKAIIDQIIDTGPCPAGHLNQKDVLSLYLKGLIYFDIFIDDNDHLVMPPLEGFVMNRVTGDYFETLLYKIFVSLDEHTSVLEMANLLEIDLPLVKDAVSLYCRLGFAKKKNADLDSDSIHPSWIDTIEMNRVSIRCGSIISVSSDEEDSLLNELNQALETDTESWKDTAASDIKDEVKAIKEQSSGDRKYCAPTTSVTQSAKSPRPPKSPLTSPRHSSADSPRISVAASPRHSKDTARNSILAPLLETNLSPRKDDPYVLKTVPEKTLLIKDSDIIPSSASIEISDFSSPAFLDISKPKLLLWGINDQKIQSISLKLAAFNISTPNSDNNNSSEVEDLPSRDASKIDNDSHEITKITEDSNIVNETSIIIDNANVSINSIGCEEFKDISVSDFSREDQSVIIYGISTNPSPVIVPVALTPLDKFKVTLRRKVTSYKDGGMDKNFDKTDMILEKEDDSNIDNDDTDGNVKNKDECEKMAKMKVKQRHIECNSDYDHTIQKINTEEIPQFYPNRASLAVIPANLVLTIQEYFTQIKGKLYLDNSDQLCEKLGLHCYLRTALFTGLGKKLNQYYTCTEFLTAYHAKARFLLKEDAELVAFHLISGFNPYIQKHNLTQIIKDIVMNHSYFEFCRSEFSGGQMLEHYKDTVVSSVLFAGDGWRQGKLTWHQFKKTAFLQSLNEVSNTEDLTRVQHFSYDQFYVIYTRFLYLDLDNDFMLGKEDVLNYDEHRILTDIIVDRIFETNLSTSSPKGLMSYADFVFFVKSEIDRFHPAAIHYWFNVLDLDYDGYLSFEELEKFYVPWMPLLIFSTRDIQSVSLTDMFTELVDTVYPSGFTQLPETDNKTAAQNKMAASSCYSSQKGGGYPKFSLQQLKSCHIFPHLLDAFLNIFKFIDNDETCQSLLYSRDSLQVWNDYLDVTMKRIDLLMDGDGEMESVME